MSHYKIIFAGPVGAGKTTAVTTASDIPPVRTDTAASDDVRDIKPQTTVALDYGAMKLADGITFCSPASIDSPPSIVISGVCQ